MTARKAACGTMAAKVGGEVAKSLHPSSYTLLQPFMGGVGSYAQGQHHPDPEIMSRVVVILRQLQAAIPVFRAMPDSDSRCPALAERIELLKVDLHRTLEQDKTGMIRASLTRIQKGSLNGTGA